MNTGHADVSVLLLGAGSGERMGGTPKAFIKHDGLTLLEHAVRSAEDIGGDILVGLQATDIELGKKLLGAVLES